MADRKRSNKQERVILPAPRYGLKRELAFALKSQSELPNSLGRTRSGKVFISEPSSASSKGGKRPKLQDGRVKHQSFCGDLSVGSYIIALPVKFPVNVNRFNSGVAVALPTTDTLSDKHPKANSKEGSKMDDTSLNSPVSTEGIEALKKDKAPEKKSGTNHRKSKSKIKFDTSKTTTQQGPLHLLEAVSVSPEERNSYMENEPVSKQSIVFNENNGFKGGNGLAEKPLRRFTRSVLKKLMPAAATPSMIEQEGNRADKQTEVFSKPTLKVATHSFSVSAAATPLSAEQEDSRTKGKQYQGCSTAEPRLLKKLIFKQQNQEEAVLATATPQTVEKENIIEIPIVVDYCGGLEFEDGLLEESIKAEHEGSVSVTTISNADNNEMVLVAPVEKSSMTPRKRITKSLLKATVEDSVVADASTLSSAGSVGSEEAKVDNDALSDSRNTASKKKMELKMSKKITLTKFPSNVRELLGTGLLEGMPVKYISCPGKNAGLLGVIRGNGILCSCSFCQGLKVVSAYQFEIHAGSTKKHPSDFIFLKNGKSLHEVLNSCSGASLDMLEAAIQNAIGPSLPIKISACHKCNELFGTARTGNFALLCNSCLDSSHQEATPSLSSFHGMTSSVKIPRQVLVPCVSVITPRSFSSQKKASFGKITKKDVGLHKLVFMDDILPQGTEVGYYVRGKRLLEGYIKDSGIFCRCCNGVVSPSQFEAHAGQASRRKPYNNIYTSNGVSLHELSISLSKGRKLSSIENDDLCGICLDGGDLLLCDLCPRAFHKECVGLSSIPSGDWFCQYCQNLHLKDKCLAKNNNAIAAGRVDGVDPIEQIIKRCIRIVTTPENDAGVCALCRQHDFSRSGFDPLTVIICDQCEIEYHVGCLKDHGMADLQELPVGKWFCSLDCSRIHTALQELLCQGPVALEDIDAGILGRKLVEKGLSMDTAADVRWRLLSDKNDFADKKLLLSQVVSLFCESFDPIVDPVSGRDLVPFMVYGRNMRDQDFSGVYCLVLTLNSSVISAGLLRVLGCEVAELPLVATKRESQGLGYFKALYSCIERMFKSLEVKHFVLPAADEAEAMWTKKFGFSKLTSTQLRDYSKGARPIIFQGTSVLHKQLLEHQELPMAADNVQIFDMIPDVLQGTKIKQSSSCYSGRHSRYIDIFVLISQRRLGYCTQMVDP